MTNLAVFPPHSLLDEDEQLAEQITLLAGQVNAANYRLLKLIAAFDDRQGWSGGGTVRSCAHWLNWSNNPHRSYLIGYIQFDGKCSQPLVPCPNPC